jgi:penicillin amidase
MKKKIIVTIGFFALFLMVGAGIASYITLLKVVPQTTGELVLKGLSKKVIVYRDDKGIPHIEAENELDLYLTLGFIHASERIFQLDLYRRASRGQLADVLGDDLLKRDQLSRTLQFESPLDHPNRVPLSLKVKTKMQAYLNGINEFVEKGPLPFEFIILGYQPEKFELRDVYAFTGYMAFLFGNAPKQDPLLHTFRKFYDLETIALMGNEPSSLPNEAVTGYPKNLDPLYYSSLLELPAVDGSNAWVISPSKTKSGKALLANDPHVGISQPGLWFEAHLKAPNFEVYGHFLPLIPFAAIGHNEEKAWGLTISYIDDMDFYEEKVNFEKNTVRYRGDDLPLIKKSHSIKVKGKDPVKFTSWIGPHGPLLGSRHENDFSKPEYALQWTYHHKDNRPLEAFYGLTYSKGIDEMRLATTLGTAPGLNIVYADESGNIAWWMYGAIPIRPRGMQGDRVYPGENGDYDWLGHMDADQKPQIENPPSGVIVSANGRPPGASKMVKGYWQPQDRAKTIHDTLTKEEGWTANQVSKLQASSFNAKALPYKSKLISYLKGYLESNLEKKALALFENWDGRSALKSVAAYLYHELTNTLLRDLFDELPLVDFNKYCRVNASWRSLYRFSELPQHRIWDLSSTKKIETMKEVVLLSFKKVITKLKAKHGANIKSWLWGKVHQVSFSHPLGARGGVLGYLLNLGPYPVSGGYNSINNFRKLGCEGGFAVKAGPSTRVVVDFEDTKNTLGGLPLGISAHRKSPYFSNERKDFLKGKPRAQVMDWKIIKNYSSLTVIPSP